MALTVVKETSIQVAEQRNLNFIVVVAQYNLNLGTFIVVVTRFRAWRKSSREMHFGGTGDRS